MGKKFVSTFPSKVPPPSLWDHVVMLSVQTLFIWIANMHQAIEELQKKSYVHSGPDTKPVLFCIRPNFNILKISLSACWGNLGVFMKQPLTRTTGPLKPTLWPWPWIILGQRKSSILLSSLLNNDKTGMSDPGHNQSTKMHRHSTGSEPCYDLDLQRAIHTFMLLFTLNQHIKFGWKDLATAVWIFIYY